MLWSADCGTTNADGGPGNDDVYGGPNPDLIIGGAGLDRMWGGAGSDELGTYDGNADHVADCGSGNDLNDYADPGDPPTNCEGRGTFMN